MQHIANALEPMTDRHRIKELEKKANSADVMREAINQHIDDLKEAGEYDDER